MGWKELEYLPGCQLVSTVLDFLVPFHSYYLNQNIPKCILEPFNSAFWGKIVHYRMAMLFLCEKPSISHQNRILCIFFKIIHSCFLIVCFPSACFDLFFSSHQFDYFPHMNVIYQKGCIKQYKKNIGTVNSLLDAVVFGICLNTYTHIILLWLYITKICMKKKNKFYY